MRVYAAVSVVPMRKKATPFGVPFHLVFAFACACLGALLACGGEAVAATPHWATTVTRTHPTTGARFRELVPADEPLDIAVVLNLRHADELKGLTNAFTDPGGPAYGQRMSALRVRSRYAPLAEQAQAVADYLRSSGFAATQIEDNNLIVRASGTAASVRKAFNTELGHFVRNGRLGIANTRDVAVPDALKDSVLAVLGLQTLDLMRPMAIRASGTPAPAGSSIQPHDPVNFPLIYDAGSLPAASGSTVAVITEGSQTPTVADLHQFESQNSLPTINPVVVNVGGGSTDTSYTYEWDIDSQDIVAMAGGQLGGLYLYSAASLTDASITAAFNRAVTDDLASVINVSLDECETSALSDGAMSADDQIFQMAIAQGQTFSVASGDSGSDECGSNLTSVAYPASSPDVIAVGGTTLSTNANGSYSGETVWYATGGGASLYESQPSWQSGVVSGGKRGLPDIAFDADPSSGTEVVVNGQLQQWGGTSLASPLFVGSWARIQSAHASKLGFPAPWIYAYGAKSPAADFHDVISGSNGNYTGAAGWDFTTGFGSFDVAAVYGLTGSSVSVSASSSTVVAGEPVTLTARVSSNVITPTGTVQFQVNGQNFGAPVSLVNGVASLTTSQLPAGSTDAITAVYSGDTDNAASSTTTAFNETVVVGQNDVPVLPGWVTLLLAGGLLMIGARAAPPARDGGAARK